MSNSVREAIPNVRELSRGPPGCPVDPLGCPGVVGRPSRMFGSYRDSLLDVREWSGSPPRCPGVVESPSRMSESGWESLPGVRECS